jgi:hypothetical protein
MPGARLQTQIDEAFEHRTKIAPQPTFLPCEAGEGDRAKARWRGRERRR